MARRKKPESGIGGNWTWFGPNDRPLEENRRHKAAMWISYVDKLDGVPIYPETEEWRGGVLDMVGEIRNLLVPIVALQVYGSAAEISAKIETVTKTLTIMRGHNDFRENFGERKQAVSELERIVRDLEEIKPRMEHAENILKAEGWQYDADAKKIRELPRGEKGRPGGLIARCSVAVYLDQYDGQRLTSLVLEGIKSHLSQFFRETDLDTRDIYWAVKSRGVSPQNRKRPKTTKLVK